MDTQLATFVVLSALLTVLPGNDTALVTKTTLLEGRRAAFATRTVVSARRGRMRSNFAQGFFTNVLNPKVALFYLIFLPQFIVPGDNVLLKSLALGMVHVAMGLPWLTAYAFLLDRLARAVTSARPWLERASGALLIGLGVRLALERR